MRQRGIVRLLFGQAKLLPHPSQPRHLEQLRKCIQGCLRIAHSRLVVIAQQRQQRLPKTGQVPVRHPRLVVVGIAASMIDRAVDRLRMIRIHEGAGAIVNRLAHDRHVVRIHHAMDKADHHPLGDQRRLPRNHRLIQREIRSFRRRDVWIMTFDHMIGQ